jgi:hypothetical protein
MAWRKNPLYQTRAWRNTSTLLRQKNPICQRIEYGVQCNRKSEVVHHLEDPTKNPSAALAWQNLVAVCTAHHPGGRPGASIVEEYCDTLGPENAVYPHRHGPPSWRQGTTLDIDASARMLVNTSAVGTTAQREALEATDLDALLSVKIPGTTS